jgi:hypothetical protein
MGFTRSQPPAASCPGGSRPPRPATGQIDGHELVTAECRACRGRFRLDGAGLVPAHRIPATLDPGAGLRIAA